MSQGCASAPGSIGNVGPGLDALGLAVEGPRDRVWATLQDDPAIVALGGGGFVIAWRAQTSGTSGDGSSTGITAQRFDASGVAQGGEFDVNTAFLSSQFEPKLAAVNAGPNSGGFVAVWTSDAAAPSGDGSGQGIYAQRFSSTGALVGTEFRVNTTVAGNQNSPVVAVLTDGSFLMLPDGREAKAFHIRDGLGFVLAHRAGLRTGLVSGRSSPSVSRRAMTGKPSR